MNKKNNSKNIQYINKCMLSQEQMIEIQEEAYYRALKRIEQEHVLNKELTTYHANSSKSSAVIL